MGRKLVRHAGIPAAGICMNCHRFVTAPQKAMVAEILAARKENRAPNPVVSPELQKLYDSLALNGKLERIPDKTPEPIKWVKVHNLPDYACFDHRAHVNAGVALSSAATDPWRPWSACGRNPTCPWAGASTAIENVSETAWTARLGGAVQPSLDCATCHH